MMNAAWWTPPVASRSQVRAAFARLGRAAQHALDAALFDGQPCTPLAQASLVALHAQLPLADGAAVLARHALGALDPDEAALIDEALAQQPALRRGYAAYEDLVGALCTMVRPIAPEGRILARLSDTIDERSRVAGGGARPRGIDGEASVVTRRDAN